MNTYYLTIHFKPTLEMLFGDTLPLRNDGYTTNGFIAFAESLEPDYLSRLKTREVSKQPNIIEMIEKRLQKPAYKAEITSEMELDRNIYIKLISEERYSWVDPRYLAFFEDSIRKFDYYIGELSTDPIVVVYRDMAITKETVAGIIMPVQR